MTQRLAEHGIPVQRVPISYADAGETLYEDPAAGGTQFVATPYGGPGIAYEMVRTPDAVTVTVRILFVNQARDQRRTLPNGQPNPNFTQDVGPQTAVPRNDPRRAFAEARCASIGGLWDRYNLVGRRVPPPADPAAGTPPPGGSAGSPAPAPGVTPPTAGPPPAAPAAAGSGGPAPAAGGGAPPSTDVTLPLKFVAQPVFDLTQAATAHSTVALFGPRTVADRSGAHPVDAGHWYMNTERNYAGMDMDAIYAHEYGHLIGLPDEYSRSNDQIHQSLHRMGGGAASSDQELDRQTVRRMVASALLHALTPRLQTTVNQVSQVFMAQRSALRTQMIAAVRGTWQDEGLRSGMAEQIRPHLPASLQRELDRIIAFQTSTNLSNVTVANEAMSGFTAQAIERAAVNTFWRRFQAFLNSPVGVTGSDGTQTNITMEFTQNVEQAASTGGGAAAGTAVADRVIGVASSGRVPPVHPSSSLLGQLTAVPAEWSEPGKGLDGAYTPAIVKPALDAAVASAAAAGAFRRTDRHRLYRRILSIVNSTVRQSSRNAVTGFLDNAIRPKVEQQVDGLQAQVNREVDSVMGMSAEAAASTAPRDPQIQALATQLNTLLTSQQNSSQWNNTGDINPGSGGAGQDVRYTMGTMMGPNVSAPEGFRGDMMQPVVDQFNAQPALRDPAAEEPFRAVRR